MSQTNQRTTDAATANADTAKPLAIPSASFQDWMLATFQIGLGEWLLIGSLIFGGCCSNVFALEVLVSNAPKSGHLITFAQFTFVAFEGLFHFVVWPSPNSTWWWPRILPSLKTRSIPWYRWAILVLFFFSVSVLNNAALAYHISVPLHIVFRSGGLIVNMAMGWFVLNKRYTVSQVSAVLLVTFGVIMATLSSAGPAKAKNSNPVDDAATLSEYSLGITLLVVAMILSAAMGLYQEETYRTYGKDNWREGLFYLHFFALPCFLIFRRDIIAQLHVVNTSTPVPLLDLTRSVPILGDIVVELLPSGIKAALTVWSVPKLWYFLSLNMITQYICISGVHRLTARSTSLTLNLVLNLRKFVSLAISVIAFNNAFSSATAAGTALVFLGTVLYVTGGSKTPAKNVAVEKRKEGQ
ncbi:hypothetical protein BC936DRAFT_145467 [Jimgerdemannia flammicorona]|uniref:UAA transporter n=1 Tax=Jimgerdemannia flammicorona TaxID=994334 RepID=A0A433D9Z4_9FUNG|nr:hypothetical protein BC936DRAFT_145467 [Jimgerdemannia flammicorona]